MDAPRIAGNRPAVLKLEPGSYYCCACGLSQNQPWCDGSHTGTGFSPKELLVDEERNYALCQCKHSGAMPLCDGTHKQVAEQD